MRSILLFSLLCALILDARVEAQYTLTAANEVLGGQNGQNCYTVFSDVYQTFTPTTAGDLAAFEFRAYAPTGCTLTVSIASVLPSPLDPHGIPDTSSVLGSASITLEASSTFAWHSVNFGSQNISATTGQALAVRFSADDHCYVHFKNGDDYAAGTYWYDSSVSTITRDANLDIPFRCFIKGFTVTSSTPYEEDFENGSQGWYADNGLWEIGMPAQTYINQAWSGTQAWMTGLDTHYGSGLESSVVSQWFDFSNLTEDPIFEFHLTYCTSAFNDGCVLELDLDDGQGFRRVGDDDWYDGRPINSALTGMTGDFWGTGLHRPWSRLRNQLTGAAGHGRARLRIRFVSDGSYGQEGFAFDDLRIHAPGITATPTTPFHEDFELPGDGWISTYYNTTYGSYANGPIWERGLPADSFLGSAYSGSHCWGTDLDSNYPMVTVAELTSPPCDLSSFSVDPVLGFALRHDFDSAGVQDGLRVEVDLGDGMGFQVLGSNADWYDGDLSYNYAPGGPGFRGTSTGWRSPRHVIDGGAGRSEVRIRFVLISDLGQVAEGALIDDIRIFAPTFPGTESSTTDDLRLEIYIDDEREVGSADACDVLPGEMIEVFGKSSDGDLVGGEYYLVGEVFATGSSYTNVAPDVWISLGPSSVLLQGGVQPPFYVPMQMGPYGASHFYYYNGGAAGYSCRVQSLIFLPATANGVYASSDAFELKFN